MTISDMLAFVPVLPESFLTIVALVMLMAGAFQARPCIGLYVKSAIIALIVTAGFLLLSNISDEPLFHGQFLLDGYALFMKMLLLLSAALVLILVFDYDKSEETKVTFELPVLMILSLVGMMIMVSANDLLSLYVGLELASLSLYVLASMEHKRTRSSEAGLKYFVLGALASGILLYGSSLIYGFTGTTNFFDLAALYQAEDSTAPLGVLVGFLLVLIGFCFKVSAVPFHMWTPDVYQGAPTPMTAFFSVAPKAASLALLIRFIYQPFGNMVGDWQQVMIFISVVTMFVGAIAALKQTNIKRLMAYSSIGHVGYMFVALAAGSQSGVHAALFYMVIYIIMNVGMFGCILLMKQKSQYVEQIHDLAGLAKRAPIVAAVITVFMFSLAGIPPLAGFLGKFFVFKAAVEAELFTLAILGVLASVIGAFYYLRIIKIMYFDEVKEPLDIEMTKEMKYLLGVTALFNVFFFISPAALLDITKAAAESLF